MSVVDAPQKTFRILIIEDDPDDIFLFKRALNDVRRILKQDIKAEVVENGLEGLFLVSLEDLTNRLPDAIVLDLNMPRLDGIKFLRSLRSSLLLKDLPVFVLTTTSATSIHEEALLAGADRVFIKPNDSEALVVVALEIIGAAMDRRRAAHKSGSA
jgi:two-component system, chemotaxis family, chemotaxis protein CheY